MRTRESREERGDDTSSIVQWEANLRNLYVSVTKDRSTTPWTVDT